MLKVHKPTSFRPSRPCQTVRSWRSRKAVASRLLTNADVSARIKELVSAVAEKVMAAEIRRRNWRVQVLQERVNTILELTELMAIEEGCRVKPVLIEPMPAAPQAIGRISPRIRRRRNTRRRRFTQATRTAPGPVCW